MKAEAAKQKQLDKETKRLEKYKFSEKDIVAEVDPKVLSGSLGGRSDRVTLSKFIIEF